MARDLLKKFDFRRKVESNCEKKPQTEVPPIFHCNAERTRAGFRESSKCRR